MTKIRNLKKTNVSDCKLLREGKETNLLCRIPNNLCNTPPSKRWSILLPFRGKLHIVTVFQEYSMERKIVDL